MNRKVLDWLQRNPQWILRSEFIKGIIDYELSKRALANCQRAFITAEGDFYGSLRDVSTFVGVREVIKIDSIFSDKELEEMRNELTNCNSADLIREKKRAKEVAISKAKDFINECDLRLEQLKFEQENQLRLDI